MNSIFEQNFKLLHPILPNYEAMHKVLSLNAHSADFQFMCCQSHFGHRLLPILRETAGSITKGPIPIASSDNFMALSVVAKT